MASGLGRIIRVLVGRTQFLHVFTVDTMRAVRIHAGFVSRKHVLIAGLFLLRFKTIGCLGSIAIGIAHLHHELLLLAWMAMQSLCVARRRHA
ncbi:hypothetical protein ACFQUU_00845 [Herbaspirillum sp. GCM10030257]|uniref:hypothetical protein n=1 Tax=Herbaspirillum sp. GCM10030257 TaxID=3273393 RepID=UPI003615ED5B